MLSITSSEVDSSALDSASAWRERREEDRAGVPDVVLHLGVNLGRGIPTVTDGPDQLADRVGRR